MSTRPELLNDPDNQMPAEWLAGQLAYWRGLEEEARGALADPARDQRGAAYLLDAAGRRIPELERALLRATQLALAPEKES